MPIAVGKQPGTQHTVASFPVNTPLTTLQTPVLASHSLNLTPKHASYGMNLTAKLGSHATVSVPNIASSSLALHGRPGASAAGTFALSSGLSRDYTQSLTSSRQLALKNGSRPEQASMVGAHSLAPSRSFLAAVSSQSTTTGAKSSEAESTRQRIPSVAQMGKLQQFSQFLEGCVPPK
jgi:hypothetical protein